MLRCYRSIVYISQSPSQILTLRTLALRTPYKSSHLVIDSIFSVLNPHTQLG